MKRLFALLTATIVLAVTFLSLPIAVESALAASGTMTAPYSGYVKTTMIHRYLWNWYPKKIEIQLVEFYKGAEANAIAEEESEKYIDPWNPKINPKPGSSTEWIMMKFHIKYISSESGEDLGADDVLQPYFSFHTKAGAHIDPVEDAWFCGERRGLDMHSVNLAPGEESDVWYGILVQKSVGYPIYKIPNGKDANGDTTFLWFTTDPNSKPLAAPSSIKAASAGYNSIKLTWGAVSGATKYEVYRATAAGGPYAKIPDVTTASYTGTGLMTGKTYYYKVRAYRLVGATKEFGPYSAVVSAKPVPAAPGSLKAASTGYNSIKLTWGAVAGATKYEVYRAAVSGGPYTKLPDVTTAGYTGTGLTTGKTYYYKVRAYCVVGTAKVCGPYSATVSAKAVPATPGSLKAIKVSPASVKLTWGAVLGVTKYELYRATSSGGTYYLLSATTATSCTNANLTKGKTYYYKVRAYRLVGSVKVYGNFSAVVKFTP